MQPLAPDKRFPFNLDLILRRGLGRTLLLCLFGLFVVPSVLIGTIGYRTAYRHVEKQASAAIGITAKWKSGRIQAFFDARASEAERRGQAAPALSAVRGTIQRMLTPPPELPESARIYMVGADLKRVAAAMGSRPAKGGATVDTAATRLWRKQLLAGRTMSSPPPPSMTYTGPQGRPVIGTYARLHLGGTPYALIVEVDRDSVIGVIHRLRGIILAILCLGAAAVLLAGLALARAIIEPLRDLSQNMTRVASGGDAEDIDLVAGNEIGELAAAASSLIGLYRMAKTENDAQSRFISGLSRLQEAIAGESDLGELCLTALEFLADFLDLHQADFFLGNRNGRLERFSRFPGYPDDGAPQAFSPGEGRIGRAALEKDLGLFHRQSPDAPASPVSTIEAANLMVVPLVMRQIVKGVLELEKRDHFSSFDQQFVRAAAGVIGAAANNALIRREETERLAQARRQIEQIKRREAALEASTSDLQAQRRSFQASEEALQLKQLELEAANAQMVQSTAALETHMAILKKQQEDMRRQNAELETAHRQLEQKARQLEISSRYKSEFMANMSHELRTPLNSILLLSRLLLENKEKTLTVRQAEFTRTIHMAGEDLLSLINEILDLAKVEAGKMEIVVAPMQIRSMAEAMRVNFAPLAEQRGLEFGIDVAAEVPDQLVTDRQRIEQIIKNFLSNAFKFTARGTIRLEIAFSREAEICRRVGNGRVGGCLAFSVTDTGIGIPAAQHEMVFDAFQQVDGSIRRKYGGTGLGLSISRELARLLGGEITLKSQSGQGSRFTLHLPIIRQAEGPTLMVPNENRGDGTPAIAPQPPQAEKADALTGMDEVADDRRQLMPGEDSVLLITADVRSIGPLKAHAYRERYKVLVAERPQTGLHFADYYLPAAVLADMQSPGENGWTIIDRIKANPNSRHIPVFTLSTRDDTFTAALHGAAGHLVQPVTAEILLSVFERIVRWRSESDRRVLVVDPDPNCRARMENILGDRPVRCIAAPEAAAAVAALNTKAVHAVLLNAALPDKAIHPLLATLQHDPIPVLLFSPAPAPVAVQAILRRYGRSVNLKPVGNPDQLLAALAAHLHLPPDAWDDTRRDRLQTFDNRRSVLEGRKVLLVDDDMRTVFAVSSILEDQGTEMLAGKTGKESLDKLDRFPDIDLILMDVMIANVDGYQVIREIRRRDHYQALPIIVLTAKAMQGDRDRCIAAGADDYLAKPVNPDKLTSMLRIWLDPQRMAGASIGEPQK